MPSNILTKLSKLCHIIYCTTGLNVALFDHDYQCTLLLCHKDYPFLTHPKFAYYKAEVLDQLGSLSDSACYLHALFDLALIYYDIRIQVSPNTVFYGCIGPVLSECYSDELITTMIHKLKIPPSHHDAFIAFYRSLPYLSAHTTDALWLSYHLLTTFPDISHLPLISQSISEAPEASFYTKPLKGVPQPTTAIIQLNYQNEVKWRHAISRGDLKAAQEAYAQLCSHDFMMHRTPKDPLRSMKNLLFSMNALGRAAAIDGGADPLLVHKTHERYTIGIENVTTATQTQELQQRILKAYCNLVLEAQTQDFSPIIAKAIRYLYANYETHITLREVATAICCSEGHLSRTFQKETGQTLGTYLNRLRIKHAISMMESEIKNISDLALAVGFSSYNKFSVEFKKYTGQSATDYLNTKRHCTPEHY